jgi:hypothetical protein
VLMPPGSVLKLTRTHLIYLHILIRLGQSHRLGHSLDFPIHRLAETLSRSRYQFIGIREDKGLFCHRSRRRKSEKMNSRQDSSAPRDKTSVTYNWGEGPASEADFAINPWQLEYRPNPVIFAHLADCFDGPSHDEYLARGIDQSSSSQGPDVALEQHVLRISKRRMSESSDVVEVKGSLAHEEASRVTFDRSKRRAYSRQPTQESSRSFSHLFSIRGPEHCDILGSPSLAEIVRSFPAHEELQLEKSSSDACQQTTPGLTSSVEESTPESSAPSDGDQSLACPECDMIFRTSGQRREHQNRRHIRRSKCGMCDRAFNLQADLGRHERTVHKSGVGAIDGGHEDSPLKCPNKGCKTADKVWDRKDNLWRHIVRCRKALGMVA